MADGPIFVSYSSADRAFAEDLVRQLEAGGNRVWFAPRNVRPGNDYSEQIQAAIEQARAFIIIVSEASNESDFVRAETEMAFSRRRPIFPVRRAAVAPAPGLALFLNLRHWTDAFGPDRHNAVARLNGELFGLGRKGRQSRKKIDNDRPYRASGEREWMRSGAVAALTLAGCGALLACLLLLLQTDDQAAAAREPEASAGVMNEPVSTSPGQQADMTQLVAGWVRYIQETQPPPVPEENLAVDNGTDATTNAAAAVTNTVANSTDANTVGM